jgi:hypothetical protein
VKYLSLFHHFKAIYQFPKHIIFLVKIVANAALIIGSTTDPRTENLDRPILNKRSIVLSGHFHNTSLTVYL